MKPKKTRIRNTKRHKIKEELDVKQKLTKVTIQIR
jgi:hypothetical protein